MGAFHADKQPNYRPTVHKVILPAIHVGNLALCLVAGTLQHHG